MSGYGARKPLLAVAEPEAVYCAIQGCDGDAFLCYGTHLCLAHGTAFNHQRDLLAPVPNWDWLVAACGAWIAAQNGRPT